MKASKITRTSGLENCQIIVCCHCSLYLQALNNLFFSICRYDMEASFQRGIISTLDIEIRLERLLTLGIHKIPLIDMHIQLPDLKVIVQYSNSKQ